MKKNVNSQNELSRQWMQLALIELLKTKDLDDITVSELTKKAGVARVTFYLNCLKHRKAQFVEYQPEES